MEREDYKKLMRGILREDILSSDQVNFFELKSFSETATEQQTSDAFSDKWGAYEETSEKEIWYKMQKDWYLRLYGFASEKDFANFLLVFL